MLAYAAGRAMEGLLAGVRPADALTSRARFGLCVLITVHFLGQGNKGGLRARTPVLSQPYTLRTGTPAKGFFIFAGRATVSGESKEIHGFLRLPRVPARKGLSRNIAIVQTEQGHTIATFPTDLLSAGKSLIHPNINMFPKRELKNPIEEGIRLWYENQGYESIHRGWPDFCFFKYQLDGTMETRFVEVKRPNQTTIKPAQKMIRTIFRQFNIDVKVAFGMNEDGTPNFKEPVDLATKKVYLS